MAGRVPTWTELRMDATKLAQLQKECYRSVHEMLDRDVPELDRKLALLGSKNATTNHKLTKSTSSMFTSNRPSKLPHSRTCNNLREISHGPALSMDYSGDLPHLYEQIGESSTPVRKLPPKRTTARTIEHKEAIAAIPIMRRPVVRLQPNLDELEHLRPLPMPISYYLKKNRPDMVRAADRRVMNLKKMAEKRRLVASTRERNALDLIRSSSRASSNRGTSSLRSSTRTVSRENVAPSYQVRYKLSEYEMRRRTARIYNKLPEVKRRQNDEVSKHMIVQNYKNKMEYGRKLLMNRRQGVIDYPLRTNYDDSSVMSSQEESLTNSLE